MWNSSRNAAVSMFVRHFGFARKRAQDLKKIDPRVPYEEATHIAEDVYGLIKKNQPITYNAAWDCIKEANISTLSSKTRAKLMLKWMQGKNILKLVCQHIGADKRFLLITLPEDPNNPILPVDQVLKSQTKSKKSTKKKANKKKANKKKKK